MYSPIINGSVTIEVNWDEKFVEEIILKCENYYFQPDLPAFYTTDINNNNENSNYNNHMVTHKCDFSETNIFNCSNSIQQEVEPDFWCHIIFRDEAHFGFNWL